MRGLECIGSFIERNILYELYKIPESSELGCITSIGNCQVHPHEWHKGRKLDPPQRYPMNTRVEMDPPDSRGVIKIRIREVRFPYRAPTKKKRVVLKI